MPLSQWVEYLGYASLILLSLAASVHILFHKHEPHNAMLWILCVWLLPVVGFLSYWYFGYNRIQRRLRRQRDMSDRAPSRDRPLRRLGWNLTGLPLREGNQVDLLEDAATAYPAMLASIATAKRSVDLLTYIFDMDEVGDRFIEVLVAAANRGVQVRVLVDGVGAWGPLRRLQTSLHAEGLQFASYWRRDKLFHQRLLNLRNHRKFLIIDSSIGYTGGLNISRRHHKGPLSRRFMKPWKKTLGAQHDLHFRLRGPVLADMEACFQEDWNASWRGAKHQRSRPKPAKAAGRDLARIVSSGPDQTFERIYEVLLGALRLAQERVDLCTPYFIPDASLLALLRSLSLSGVKVRLFVPFKCDHQFMNWASRSYFRDLLEAGIEIWEIRAEFVHSKAVVVDGSWCMVGSCNLDPRSFLLNFETNVEVYSKRLGRDINQVLEKYKQRAHRVDLDLLKRQGFWIHLRDSFARLFSPLI